MQFRRFGILALAGLGICFLLALLALLPPMMGGKTAPDRPLATTNSQVSPKPSVNGRPAEPPTPTTMLADLPRPDEPAARTVQQLLTKGLPLMTRPRREVVDATASQSIEDAVMDLGDLYSIGSSSIHTSSDNYAINDIRRWQAMTRNVKLLRVIEEGRRDPKRIGALLEAEIARSLDSLAQVQADAIFEMANMATGESKAVVSNKDEFYRKNHRYANAALEHDRRHESAYAAFYALANIEGLTSSSLLAKWIEVPRPPMTNAKDMNVWLIHQYFQQARSQDPAAAGRHDALAAQAGLSSDSCLRARWNGLWDIDDPMLKRKGVDVSGIPTISVLKIPQEINIDETRRDAIIANFLAHARQPNPR